MPRTPLPQLIDADLHLPAPSAVPPIRIGSLEWQAWLAVPTNRAFSVPGTTGTLTVRREPKGDSYYWYAYQRHGPRLRKAYLGKDADLTLAKITAAFATLARAEPSVTQTALRDLRLLGTPHLRCGDAPIHLSAAKALVLLAYVALADGPQPRERLLDLLWPESSPAAARKNLRNTLWVIRSTLGDDLLHIQGERIGLAAQVACDLRRFQALCATPDPALLTIYRGPLLDGVSLLDAPEAELWLTSERERLLQCYLAAADHLVAQQAATADWDALAHTAQHMLRHDPLHEAAYRALMEALARRGDRAAALRQYERLRTTLDRELGVSPEPASEALHDAIVRGVFAPTLPARPAPSNIRPAEPAAAPFVGREAEQAVLSRTFAHASAGQAQLVILSGELGIGKSALWQHWISQQPTHSPLVLQCLEATQELPFAPLIAYFSTNTWRTQVAQIVAHTPNAPPFWLHALSQLLPDLLAPPLLAGEPTLSRQRLFEAFVQALLAVSAAPYLLIADDLQWADTTTLDWLEYALHRLRELPVLLIVSYRSEATSADLLRRIAQWERMLPPQRIALQRLNPSEATHLLRQLGVHTDVSRLIHESAGNPYFLCELAQSNTPHPPPVLRDLVRARLDALPEPARQLLQAAAVLEPDLDGLALLQISTLDETEALTALDTLLAQNILHEQGEAYQFSHPLIASVVRTQLNQIRRATLHRRAATVLTQLHAQHLPAQAGRIAAHYRAAGDPAQAAHYATLAGDYALSITAITAAVQFYEQAIAAEPSAMRSLRLGRALGLRGDQQTARNLLDQAYAAFHAAGDRQQMALVYLVQADLALAHGGYALAGELAQRARDLIDAGDPFITASTHILIGTAARARGDFATAQQEIDTCMQIATAHDLHEVQMYAALGLSNIRAEQGDLAGAYAAAQQIIRLAAQIGNSFYEVIGQNNAAYRALQQEQFAAAHTHIAAGLALAEARALELPRQWLYSTRGELALAEAAWHEAEQWLTQAYQAAEQQHNQAQLASITANLGRAAAGRGDTAHALHLLRTAWEASAHVSAHAEQRQIGIWFAAQLSTSPDPADQAEAARIQAACQR
jgi:DNA-binding SARP family transcriptional activator